MRARSSFVGRDRVTEGQPHLVGTAPCRPGLRCGAGIAGGGKGDQRVHHPIGQGAVPSRPHPRRAQHVVFVERAQPIGDVGGMVGADRGRVLIGEADARRIGMLAGEQVEVGRHALRRLRDRAAPRRAFEATHAAGLPGDRDDLLIGRDREQAQEVGRGGAECLGGDAPVIGDGAGLGERVGALVDVVAIVAGDDRHAIVPPLRQRLALRQRQHIAVDDRPADPHPLDMGADLRLGLRRQDAIGRHVAHRLQVGGADRLLHLQPGLLGGGEAALVAREIAAARHDCGPEQPGGHRAEQVGDHRARAGGLADDHHLVRIAAELGDVRAHPLERGDLVHDPVIARMAALLAAQRRMREEAERADPIVEVDEHGAGLGHRLAVVVRHAGGADRVAAAVKEHDHGQLRAGPCRCGRPQVQIEAILAGRLLAEIMVDVVRTEDLHAFGATPVGVPHAVPADRRRCLPAQRAHRRLGEGHAEIGAHARGEPRARHLAAVDGEGVAADPHHGCRQRRRRHRRDGACRARDAHFRSPTHSCLLAAPSGRRLLKVY